SESGGDDWSLVNRILATVPASDHLTTPRNLMIVDSIAGFETLVGDLDAFGQRITRRARLAQMLRAAVHHWNLVLIVEEPREGDHTAEEFVTDMVIRLRRNVHGNTTRRTLEIEKARSAGHGIGEHPFAIRDGLGSSTRSWENPDDPATELHKTF